MIERIKSKRATVKTFTYLIIDLLTHASIIYFAGLLFNYPITLVEIGAISIAIEILETIMYYLHEVVWENISLWK